MGDTIDDHLLLLHVDEELLISTMHDALQFRDHRLIEGVLVLAQE
jgi:hypothetical protein